MSFEDDEYWEDEYSEYSIMPQSAVVQERQYQRRDSPDPIIPTRRGEPGSRVDELAARRQRRAHGNAGGEPRAAFDAARPSWLDDPDFSPVDTSQPNLAGDDFSDVDFNRPELGADFDAPDTFADSVQRRHNDRYDRHDDIDEPYDHRDLVAYGHGPNPGVRTVSRSDDDEPAGRRRERQPRRATEERRPRRSPDERDSRGPRRSSDERDSRRSDSRRFAEERDQRRSFDDRDPRRPVEERRPRPDDERQAPAAPAASGRARVPDDPHNLYRRPTSRRDDGYDLDDRPRRPRSDDGLRSGGRAEMLWDEPAAPQRGYDDNADVRGRGRTERRRPDGYELDERRRDGRSPWPAEAEDGRNRPPSRDYNRRTIDGEVLDERAPRTIEGEIVEERRRPARDDRRAPTARQTWDDQQGWVEDDRWNDSRPAGGQGRTENERPNDGRPAGGQGWTENERPNDGRPAGGQGWTENERPND
ncbi:hypothetical protein LXN57_09455, partial [Actinoplanes sp. TRM88002]